MYTVLRFFEDSGQLLVKFDGSNPICIDVPIEDNRYLEGDALKNYINSLNPSLHRSTRSLAIEAGIDNVEYMRTLDTRTSEDKIQEKMAQVRAARDENLRASDWLVLPDTGFTPEAVARFKHYRQQLRDIPQQPGFPEKVSWPVVEGEWPNRKDRKN